MTKRGTVRLTNHKKGPVEVRVRVGTGGKVIGTEGDPEIALRGFDGRDWANSGYDHRMNAHSDLTWTLTLEAGATREVSYVVEMFLR